MIAPGSAEHNALISPSKVATILGISRWDSPYALWHRMRGDIPSQPASDIFNVGHAFEQALAALWRIENPGWRLSRGEVQLTSDSCAFGFPWVCTLDRRASRGSRRKVVELKTARDLSVWGDDFTGDVPADYAAQVIAQQLFSGYHDPAHLLVMGPFFAHHTYVIDYDADVAAMILDRCRAWWASLHADEPPPLDDTVATYECVRAMHPDIDQGVTVEIDAELAEDYVFCATEAKTVEANLRGKKTAILDAMGRAEIAVCDGQVVAKRVTHKSGSVWLRAGKGAA